MSVEAVLSPSARPGARDEAICLDTPTNTPSKTQEALSDWKSCYEITENIAAIYPSSTRIPMPFAIPRESFDDMSESQRKAVCWMWYNLFDACRGGILTDSLANNLVQVSQFLNGLCLPKLVFKCLLIVPTQSVDLWVSALLQLAPRIRVVEFTGPNRERRLSPVLSLGGIVVTTYGVAVNDLAPKSAGDDNWGVEEDSIWDIIVFDQAERLKDTTSKTNEALCRLQGTINLLLTSHPILKHPKDLYSLFDFACEADIFGSYDLFKDRYEVPINRASSKRADDMDRQLAAVARLQLAEAIESQYWQNWDELLTPGGSKRIEDLPSFITIATPFKDRTNLLATPRDIPSTPSFTKGKIVAGRSTAKRRVGADELGDDLRTPSRPRTTLKGPRKSTKKNKPLIPTDSMPMMGDELETPLGLEELEHSISKLDFGTPKSTTNRSTEGSSSNPIVLDDQTVSTTQVARRTPNRNQFFAQATPSKPAIGAQLDKTPQALTSNSSSVFSPEMLKTRQRLSFGRISLCEDSPSEKTDSKYDDDDELENMEFDNWDRHQSDQCTPLSKSKSGLSNAGRLERSLVSLPWSSTEAFLKRRESFAEKLFVELNRVIFNAKLPTLRLAWRKMKNCAGIYHLKDSSITLSSTLLTNSARLTSTLAHEMAHAATHLLDNCPNDRHGPVWQKWARIGHARYPNVVTGSVYHNYCSQNLHPDDA